MNYKSITSIICITILLVVAVLKGIDGVLLASDLALIGGLGGYAVAKKKK